MWIFGFFPGVCSTESSNLVFSLECLVSNERQALLWGIRLGGSATPKILKLSKRKTGIRTKNRSIKVGWRGGGDLNGWKNHVERNFPSLIILANTDEKLCGKKFSFFYDILANVSVCCNETIYILKSDYVSLLGASCCNSYKHGSRVRVTYEIQRAWLSMPQNRSTYISSLDASCITHLSTSHMSSGHIRDTKSVIEMEEFFTVRYFRSHTRYRSTLSVHKRM